jgi:hypothetical protein
LCPIAESTKHSQGLDIDQSGIGQRRKIFLDGIIVAHSEMIVIANSLAVVKLDEQCNAIELVMKCYCFHCLAFTIAPLDHVLLLRGYEIITTWMNISKWLHNYIVNGPMNCSFLS